ncbi:protein phosphatase 1 regulatory subunit 15A-like [Clarias magur]|uniref:Protein DP71L n=1 Tax=Clarias magur TaxID=1594786 RepID=A0A8J4XG44_CLAMG|nr:protein phosphatase 1 regulatory subunit 15A-like [Clarias magur]
MKSMTVEVKDWSEHDAWNKDVKMSTVLDKTVKPQMKMVIQSDLVEMPDFLLSDCLECQSEEQGKRDDDQTEWSDEDLFSDGVSEMSSENRGLWEFFLNTHDPYNPLHFCSTEDKAKHSDHEEEEKDNVQDPQEQNETELIEEEDSDWSDEDDLEMPAESRVLWESFNSDPYNPLCFSGPTVVKTRTSEIQQDHKPSSPTTGVLEENDPEQSTKRCAKKVLFSEKVTIHNLEDWGSASQEARDGSCWMEMARDRARFKRRVENTGELIRWCLTAEHRAKVLDRLVISSDSVPADQ